ncbi:hemerythrin family protein [bacterium]|nr:hemerythrin family protein [bacterium]
MGDDLHLNVSAMDERHDEFLEILARIQSCEADAFMALFSEMIEHTKAHFAFEEELMSRLGFNSRQEHLDEHATILNEMNYFFEKAKRMPAFGKSYINDYAYEKFKRHVTNIDSQLAMFLKEKNRIGIDGSLQVL